MKSVRRGWLADAAALLICAMIVAAVLLERATPERIAVEPSWGSQGTLGGILLLLPGASLWVG